jgi:hypothetical protein
MVEEIQTFFFAECPQEFADSPPEARNCPLCGFAQECLKFAKDLFNWIEIGGTGRQNRRIFSFDRLRHADHFVSWNIIHNDNVAALERWGKTLFDISDEDLPVDWAVYHEGCDYSALPQAGDQSDRLPVGIPRLLIAVTISSSVKSGCSVTKLSSHFACASNGDVLPPQGFA